MAKFGCHPKKLSPYILVHLSERCHQTLPHEFTWFEVCRTKKLKFRYFPLEIKGYILGTQKEGGSCRGNSCGESSSASLTIPPISQKSTFCLQFRLPNRSSIANAGIFVFLTFKTAISVCEGSIGRSSSCLANRVVFLAPSGVTLLKEMEEQENLED